MTGRRNARRARAARISSGARRLVPATAGAAGEDAPPAGRLARAPGGEGGWLGAVRALDLDALESHPLDVAPAGAERPDRQAVGRHALGHAGPPHERHADDAGAGADRHAHGEGVVAARHAPRPRRRPLAPRVPPSSAARTPSMRMSISCGSRRPPLPCSATRRTYSPSSGKWWVIGSAAPRPEGRLLAHAFALDEERRDGIADDVGLDGGITDREAADIPGRRHVPLQHAGGDGQDVRVVVEAVGEVVGRQHRPDVHRQAQQIADRVGVLQPVEPVDGRSPGVGAIRRGPVEPRLQPRREPVVRLLGRPRAARRRHRARPQFLEDLLPDLGRVSDARHVHAVEREVAGPRPLVVAADAVAVEHGAVRLRRVGRDRRRAECRGARPGGLGAHRGDGGGTECRGDPQHERQPRRGRARRAPGRRSR